MKISISTRDLNSSKFQMRKQGLIPGIVYSKNKNIPIVITEKEFGKAMSKHEPIMETSMGDMVIVKEIQRDHFNKIIHVSFFEIAKGSKFTAIVPVVLSHEGINYSSQGKFLRVLKDRVEIKTTSEDMVDHITVDVSEMKVHDVLRVKDLPKLKGIEVLEDEEMQLAILDYIQVNEEPEEPKKAATPAEVPLVGATTTPDTTKA